MSKVTTCTTVQMYTTVMKCDVCGKGEMEPDFSVIEDPTDVVSIRHKCTRCGAVDHYTTWYPMRWTTPVENEKGENSK